MLHQTCFMNSRLQPIKCTSSGYFWQTLSNPSENIFSAQLKIYSEGAARDCHYLLCWQAVNGSLYDMMITEISNGELPLQLAPYHFHLWLVSLIGICFCCYCFWIFDVENSNQSLFSSGFYCTIHGLLLSRPYFRGLRHGGTILQQLQ